jgi:hypothetical protein
VLLFAGYLAIRMVVGRPHVVKGKPCQCHPLSSMSLFLSPGTHSSGLHTYQCSWDVWDYCAAIG